MSRSEAAERLWDDMYRSLAADDPGGLLGSAVSRAEAHLLRLSVAFALADTSAEIRVDHLEAAHGLWQYCRASAGLLFGDRNGDPIRKSNFGRRIWQPAVTKAGLDGLRFHDLRHCAVAFAIAAGAHPRPSKNAWATPASP